MSTAIKRVDVFGYRLTYVHGDYAMSGGRTITALPSTVLRVTTDDGVEGFGETCPLGPAYLPAHAEGARAALRALAPAVLGLPVENLAAVNRALDAALMGHRRPRARNAPARVARAAVRESGGMFDRSPPHHDADGSRRIDL